MCRFYLFGFLLLMSFTLTAQNHYNIRLDKNTIAPLGMVCYDVQLASADARDLNLAGQNYRMYYDAEKLKFNPTKSRMLLPEESYTDLIIRDNKQDINAAGAGPLSFDSHLSFLNLGNDLKDEIEGGIILPASGEWISTANVCFDVVSINTASLEIKDLSVFWARQALTQSYATAYVEIAEWKAPNITVPAKAAMYFDEELNTSSNEQLWVEVPQVYPNPTRDKVNIEYRGAEALLLQVYSTNGQLLLEDKYPANANQFSIQLGSFSAGVYQLKLSAADKFIVKRIERIQ